MTGHQGPKKPCAIQPDTLEALTKQCQPFLDLPRFTSEDAWAIGTALRTALRHEDKAVVMAIFLASNSQLLFWAVNKPGTTPDNEFWVRRKLKTALRFYLPTYYLSVKFQQDEPAFAAKYGLSPEDASSYAIHGGAVPLGVRGVEGPVAVVIVSGLKQDEDHGVVVEALEKWVAEQRQS